MITQPSELVMDLIESGKISRETICIAGNISEKTLVEYLSGNVTRMKPCDIQYLDELAMLIGHGLMLVPEDERVKVILENLICDYGFTSTQLSRLLNIDFEIIEGILHSKEVSLDDKYRLAVKEAYLFYALKRGK